MAEVANKATTHNVIGVIGAMPAEIAMLEKHIENIKEVKF